MRGGGAPRAVIEFDMGSNQWDASGKMERRSLLDPLYGIDYPMRGEDCQRNRRTLSARA